MSKEMVCRVQGEVDIMQMNCVVVRKFRYGLIWSVETDKTQENDCENGGQAVLHPTVELGEVAEVHDGDEEQVAVETGDVRDIREVA